MESEKRVIVAFVLSFVVLMMWRVFFVKEPPPTAKPGKTVQTDLNSSQSPAPAAPQAAPQKPPAPVQLPVLQGTQARELVVENDLYRVTFSTQGGVIKSWILKKYRDSNGKPLDVVNGPACEQMGYPMSLSLADADLASRLNQAIYVSKPAQSLLQPPVSVEFNYSDGKVEVHKRFSFSSGYEVRAKISAFDGQHDLPIEADWPGGFGDHSVADAMEMAATEAAYDSGGKLETVAEHKIKEARLIPGPLSFAGLEDRYFAGIFFPGSPQAAFRFARKSWKPADWKEKEQPAVLTAQLGTSQPQPLDFRLFVAPKDLDVLRSTNPPLDNLVDFGWFSVIAKPLFLAMRYIYDHWVHNYGWAIIILTFLINMALFPLKLKSIRSAQEMQRIAPLVKSIQDRYKQYKFNDPRKQRMNQEVMKLYQEHHINPLGGCLPMLLQLPILYGFYRVLEMPIELRHAPWILWIKDLSMPDHSHVFGLPIPILPTIMIVTMFMLQRMTPMATADPAQKRMMMVMPLIFGLMFFRLASGLVLYFLAANLVGIAQQVFINKVFTPTQPPPVPQKAVAAKV